jgi:diacylglycerol O-acyltransferase
MQRLSGQDALFLHLDQPHAATHATLIYIYDQSELKGEPLRFRDIVQHVEERLDASPLFRRRIVQVSMGLGYPYWEDDANFDIDFHIRHFALPKPGDWRQFCILASRIHARTLDLSRPPWEMYVIEGLDNCDWLPKGSFAILTKVHHAAVDGTAMMELTWALHDIIGARAKSVPVVKAAQALATQRPAAGLASYISRVVADNVSSMKNLAGPVARALPKVSATAMKMLARAFAGQRGGAPKTRFNGKITAQRNFGTAFFDLEDAKRIKNAVPGATLNDAVLAIVGGALRRYLLAKKDLPDRSLVAMAPVNTRQDAGERQTSGNTISLISFPLGSDIADPLERIAAVQAATAQTKAIQKAIGARDLTDISRFAPPATLALTGRLVALAGFGGGGPVPLFNCAVSNVPGPTQPLYMMGAKLCYLSAVAPIMDGGGLFFAVSSYCGRLFIAPTSSPSIVPDPEFLVECVYKSFEEMKQAVGKTSAKRGTPRQVSRAKKKPSAPEPAPVAQAARPKRRAAQVV